MAEDGETDDYEETEQNIRKRNMPKQGRKGNVRIDELSTPNRRLILACYREHAHHFEPQRVEALKAKLEELYAMSPEETEQYFENLRLEARRAAIRKRMKMKLRKFVEKRRQKEQVKQAYKLFRRLLKKSMNHAFKHDPPALVTIRLRFLSDIILEQLCDLREVDVPSRENRCLSKLDHLLMSIADWYAVLVENLYYQIQVKKNLELEDIELEAKDYIRLASSKEDETTRLEPLATSTPKSSKGTLGSRSGDTNMDPQIIHY